MSHHTTQQLLGLAALLLCSSALQAESATQFPKDVTTTTTTTATQTTVMLPVAPTPMMPMQAPPSAYYPAQPMYGYGAYPVQPWAYRQPYPQGMNRYPAYPSYPTYAPYAMRPVPAAPAMNAPRYASPYNPALPATPGPKSNPAQSQQTAVKKPTKPWGDTRHIWPDFYTDMTGDMWDKMWNGPYDMGRMPGGWRFPSFSSPDPVTVGDAVANQVPPIMEEVPNFMNFTN